jgi:uncharacterized protein YcaQ
MEPPTLARLADITGAVCGIQAQVLSAAELCLATRSRTATREDVHEELWRRRSLVKTYGMRSTLHLFPAHELSLWMAAMRAPRMGETLWYEAHGLDRTQAEALIKAVGEALDGRRLSRAELASAVAARVGSWAGERLGAPWADLLDVAAYAGVLCYGPSRGPNVTFMRMDQWTARAEEIEPEDAVREVLRRYLTAYGPAAPKDFGQWFQMKPSRARELMLSLSDELEEVDVEGSRAWAMADDAEDDPEPAGMSLRLLPQYDCYIIGCRQRARFIDEGARRRLAGYGRGRFEGPVAVPLLLIDGMVAGMWRRKHRGTRLDVRVEPFTELTKKDLRRLEEQAERIAGFYGMEVELTVGPLDRERRVRAD